MLAIKSWLETTSMSVAEERFLKPPALPYVVFTETTTVGGADDKNLIADRQISIELYSNKIDLTAEQSIETLLNGDGTHYTKSRTWIDVEMFFQTVYDFTVTDKM